MSASHHGESDSMHGESSIGVDLVDSYKGMGLALSNNLFTIFNEH